MINLSRHIEYQLLYHNIVVVPQLGTFKVSYIPSKWIEEEEIFLPPYRALSFTRDVDEKDTRFIETLSACYQISTEEASIVTLEFTENIQQELNEYGSYELGSIGEFVQEEATSNIQFIPCQAGVASPHLYGLDAIHVHPIKQEASQTAKPNKGIPVDTDTKKITISINRRILHYMTTVAASIILFFAFSTPVADNIVTQKQEIRSELLQPSNVISTTIEEFIQAEKNSEVTTSEKEGKTETINDNTSTEKQQKELEESSTTFSVVLCCGVPIQNATSYCENLNKQGINAIVDTSGKFIRVLIPGFSSREDALKEVRSLRSISKEFSNAWVMEKK